MGANIVMHRDVRRQTADAYITTNVAHPSVQGEQINC